MSAQFLQVSSSVVINGVTHYCYQQIEDFSGDYQNSAPLFDAPNDVIENYWTHYGSEESTSSGSSDDGQSSDYSEVSLENFKNLSGEEVHAIVMGWRLTAEERNINGYPGIGGNRERLVAVVPPTVYDNGKKMWIDHDDKERKCCRCSADFEVDEFGDFPHGDGMCRYQRDGEEVRADCHVTAQKFASELLRFVSAPLPNGRNDKRSKEIYALDCEMVWTLAGPALGRASLVSMNGELVLDLLVKPPTKVVDPCTEFSGLAIDMVEQAEETIESAQAKLFEFVNSDTVLIGHSLESDLKALQLIHWNTVDTALLYADDYGNKVALRELSQQLLGRNIQQDNPDQEGHCSYEDALACIDLIKYKLNYCI